MKTIYLLITCLLIQWGVFAQEGVNFRNLTFNEALAQAKAEKKMVFMDCYTSWCGPCKNMTNNVFPQKAAGDYFNPRFVCVKYDMEKGEGKELADKFEVHAYPTFIVFRPDGTIQHRVVGSDNLETFIQRIERGLNEKTSLPYLNERYEKGKMNKQELMTYKEILSETGEDEKAGKVYKELLPRLTSKDKVQKEFWPIYEDESCVIGSPEFDFLLANLPAIRKNSGTEKVDKYLFHKYVKILEDYILGYQKEDAVPVSLLKQQIPGLNIKQQKTLNTMLPLAEMVSNREVKALAAVLESKIPTANVQELKMYVFAYRAIRWQTQDADSQPQFKETSNKLTDLIISSMENKQASLTLTDLETYPIILTSLQENMSKNNYSRLAAIGEKVIPDLPDSQEKRYIQKTYEKYRKLSCTKP